MHLAARVGSEHEAHRLIGDELAVHRHAGEVPGVECLEGEIAVPESDPGPDSLALLGRNPGVQRGTIQGCAADQDRLSGEGDVDGLALWS
jgi:hypothetical protein